MLNLGQKINKDETTKTTTTTSTTTTTTTRDPRICKRGLTMHYFAVHIKILLFLVYRVWHKEQRKACGRRKQDRGE